MLVCSQCIFTRVSKCSFSDLDPSRDFRNKVREEMEESKTRQDSKHINIFCKTQVKAET